MNIERLLCDAFCDGISVEQVDAGLAVATSFEDPAGDRIGFYLVRESAGNDLWRIEDDGSLVPTLMASGVNVTDGTRGRMFHALLTQAGAHYDAESGEIKTDALTEDELPTAALKFVALLIRVAGLNTLRTEIVNATFREDAIKRIKADLSGKFEIVENAPLNEEMGEFEPDLVLRAANAVPIALFIAVSNDRLYEAILMRMAADYEAHQPCSVVALLDREGSKLISRKQHQRAANRLDAVPVFYGEEGAAVARIAKEAERRVH